ncbi:GIY-YIG nuclease family protein [Flavobacterium sp. LT1R49]|uniref:GIY-YIG nuclease family protein n=1 Tax=Flavobacterium arabinosi TaxID=3398737 RepID=UPI003A85477E
MEENIVSIENSSKEIRFQNNLILEEYRGDKIRFSQCFVKDGDWIEENKVLFTIQTFSKSPSFPDRELWCSSEVRSIKNGIIEFKKKQDEPIVVGDLLCVIHPLGIYPFENTPLRPTYKFYFDLNKIHLVQLRNGSIKEWFKQDGEFVEKGEKIFSITVENELINYVAEKEGYIEIVKKIRTESYSQAENKISHYELIYVIRDEETHNIWVNDKFKNIPEVIVDDFTRNKTIRWEIGRIKTKSLDDTINLDFSFNNINNKDYIVFNFITSDLKLRKDDNVSFLFEDGRIISFKINNPSYKINQYWSENKAQITDDEIFHFEKEKFSKWKIYCLKTKNEILGGIIGKYGIYNSSIYLILVIQRLAKEYRELVRNEIPDYKPLLEHNIVISQSSIIEIDECYVYLMIDTINQYHKIGISNKPSWREKTLQSEKPSIELIASKKFVSRRIALSIEKAFHNTFADKRVRGEWFQLNEMDIEEIRITLTN